MVTRLISDVHFHITGPKLTFKTYNYRHWDTCMSPKTADYFPSGRVIATLLGNCKVLCYANMNVTLFRVSANQISVFSITQQESVIITVYNTLIPVHQNPGGGLARGTGCGHSRHVIPAAGVAGRHHTGWLQLPARVATVQLSGRTTHGGPTAAIRTGQTESDCTTVYVQIKTSRYFRKKVLAYAHKNILILCSQKGKQSNCFKKCL